MPVYGKRILNRKHFYSIKPVNKKVQAQNISVRPENCTEKPVEYWILVIGEVKMEIVKILVRDEVNEGKRIKACWMNNIFLLPDVSIPKMSRKSRRKSFFIYFKEITVILMDFVWWVDVQDSPSRICSKSFEIENLWMYQVHFMLKHWNVTRNCLKPLAPKNKIVLRLMHLIFSCD